MRKKQRRLRKTRRNYKKGGSNKNNKPLNTSKWTKENFQKYMNNEYQKYLNEINEENNNNENNKNKENKYNNFNNELNDFDWETVPYKTKKQFLHPGNYTITNEENSISTAGLATCSALRMKIGKKKFLVHLSAITQTHNIIRDIEKTINEQKATPTNVIIYAGGGFGNMNSNVTIKKAKEICKALKIPDNEIEIQDVCFMNTIYV